MTELGVTGFGLGFDWAGKIFEIGFGRTVVDLSASGFD